MHYGLEAFAEMIETFQVRGTIEVTADASPLDMERRVISLRVWLVNGEQREILAGIPVVVDVTP